MTLDELVEKNFTETSEEFENGDESRAVWVLDPSNPLDMDVIILPDDGKSAYEVNQTLPENIRMATDEEVEAYIATLKFTQITLEDVKRMIADSERES